MLTFEEIEDCFPDGVRCDDATGKAIVSAQWLHDFAHSVAAKEREACALECEADESGRDGGGYFADIVRSRSNA